MVVFMNSNIQIIILAVNARFKKSVKHLMNINGLMIRNYVEIINKMVDVELHPTHTELHPLFKKFNKSFCIHKT